MKPVLPRLPDCTRHAANNFPKRGVVLHDAGAIQHGRACHDWPCFKGSAGGSEKPRNERSKNSSKTLLYTRRYSPHSRLRKRGLTENTDDYQQFFTALRLLKGFIAGSVALAVLQKKEGRLWTPHNLNVALPAGTGSRLASFLEEIGYEQAETFGGRCDAIKRTYCYVANDGRRPIILLEGRDEYALSTVLGTSSSGLMNVLDGINCISFYSKLTLAGICRGGDIKCPHDVLRIREQGLEYREDSGNGLALCGYSCAKLWRSVRGLRGIGAFQWGEIGAGTENAFWETPLRWRLGGNCQNIFCAHL